MMAVETMAEKGSGWRNGTAKVQSSKFKVQSSKRRVQSPKSKVQSPKSKVQSPKSKVQSPKSKVQSPKSKVLCAAGFDSGWELMRHQIEDDVDTERVGDFFRELPEILLVLTFAFPTIADIAVVDGDNHHSLMVVEDRTDVHFMGAFAAEDGL